MSPRSPEQDESLLALGRAIAGAREEKGLTREELGRAADLPEGEIEAIETGRRNPTWGEVRRVSYGLDLAVDELVRRVEEIERES